MTTSTEPRIGQGHFTVEIEDESLTVNHPGPDDGKIRFQSKGLRMDFAPDLDGEGGTYSVRPSFTPWRLANPRVRLIEDSMAVKHHCMITRRWFTLPAGSPVFVLEADKHNCDGTPLDEDPFRITIHPELAVQGPEALARQIAEAAAWYLDDAEGDLTEAVHFASLMGLDIETTWPAYWEKGEDGNLRNVKPLDS